MLIEDYLASRKMTQTDLAKALGCTRAAISIAIKRGRMSSEMAKRVVELTGGKVSLEEALYAYEYRKHPTVADAPTDPAA